MRPMMQAGAFFSGRPEAHGRARHVPLPQVSLIMICMRLKCLSLPASQLVPPAGRSHYLFEEGAAAEEMCAQ